MKNIARIMMRNIASIIWLMVFQFAYGQEIKVWDSHGLPIAGVMVTDLQGTISLKTDEKGKVDISALKNTGTIRFYHPDYEEVTYEYQALEQMEFSVIMNRRRILLDEVVISAGRWEEAITGIPNRIETLRMREVAFQNPQTTADLLGSSGYAFIQKSQLGGGSPMIRGMATSRLLIVVDGVRMNTAIFRSGNVQNVISLDANAMEGTEIFFGPGSVMYGSDAIGGVMNFQTLKPKWLDSASTRPVKVTGNAMSRYSTANQEKTEHLDFNVQLKKLSFLTSFTFSDYKDLRSGSQQPLRGLFRPFYVMTFNQQDYVVPNPDSALQVGSGYHQINFMQKVRGRLGSFGEWEYGYHFSETSRYNRYDRLYVIQSSGTYQGMPRWAEWYYGPQKWQMHRLNLKSTLSNRLFDAMNLILAYQFFEESRYDRKFMSQTLRMQKENVHAFSLNLDFEKKILEKLSLRYGWESVYNLVHSRATQTDITTYEVTPTATRYPDGSIWLSNGAYVSARYALAPKWSISAGLRGNHFYLFSSFDTTFFPFPYLTARLNTIGVSGSIGLTHFVERNFKAYLNLSSGFRAPNVDDMSKVFESVPGYLVVPNPDLKPEKAYNLEVGGVKTLGNWLKVDASVYYTWLVDAMARQNFALNGDTTIDYAGSVSRIQAVQNVLWAQVYGLQAGLELFYKGWGIRANFSYQKGREQAPDSLVYYPLRHAAPAFGTVHLTYEKAAWKCDFYTVFNTKMDYEDLALTEREDKSSYTQDDQGNPYVPSWYTLNFKLAFSPKPLITLYLGVENILDRMYRPYSSGINAPGRNFIASLKVRF